MPNLLITGITELVTMRGPVPRWSRALNDPGIIRDGALLIRGEKIDAVGTRKRVERLREAKRARTIDLDGLVVLPGFVDSHTHLVHPASRTDDYERRIRGASYEQIAQAGGGILHSVEKLQRTPAAKLKTRAAAHLREFAVHGTTTVEAKSGYGLNLEDEIKILKIYKELQREQPVEIVPTFLGAHVVPQEYRREPDKFVEQVADDWIPKIAALHLAEFCDVFCDVGAFTVEQARRILVAGEAHGLIPRIHADQLALTGATRLAIQLHAASADHLDKISRTGIRELAGSKVVATLLPGCCFHLGLRDYAPARKLIDAGAIVALASDFNPGTSPTLNMQIILSLACTQMHMTPAEAIAAATINPAYSLRRGDQVGSLEVGKYADLAAFDVADHREIPYHFGMNRCVLTMKRGKILYSRIDA